MFKNRELSQFGSFITVDETGNNSVGIGTNVIISAVLAETVVLVSLLLPMKLDTPLPFAL